MASNQDVLTWVNGPNSNDVNALQEASQAYGIQVTSQDPNFLKTILRAALQHMNLADPAPWDPPQQQARPRPPQQQGGPRPPQAARPQGGTQQQQSPRPPTQEELNRLIDEGIARRLAEQAQETPATPTSPAPPTISARIVDGGVELNWNRIQGATDYAVLRRTRTTPFEEIGSSFGDTQLFDQNVEPGQTYRYCVVAVSDNWQTEQSTAVSVSIPQPRSQTSPTSSSQSGGSILDRLKREALNPFGGSPKNKGGNHGQH